MSKQLTVDEQEYRRLVRIECEYRALRALIGIADEHITGHGALRHADWDKVVRDMLAESEGEQR